MRPSRLAVSRCGTGKVPHGMRKTALAEAARMRRFYALECKTAGTTIIAYHCPTVPPGIRAMRSIIPGAMSW